MMHKKVVVTIAIIVGVLIIASGVVGAIVAFNRQNAPKASPESSLDPDPAKQEAQTSPDLSVDLGACTVVSHSVISDAVKPMITEVRDANNRGFGHEANGDRSQSCVYAFSATDNLMNRFTLTVTEFSNETNKSNAIEGFQGMTVVSGVGDKAFSSTDTDETLNQTIYSLFVIKDMKQYTLIILQPQDTNKFTSETANKALLDIAKAIK